MIPLVNPDLFLKSDEREAQCSENKGAEHALVSICYVPENDINSHMLERCFH